MSEAIGDLGRMKNPIDETVAKSLEGRFDPRHFDDIDAGAQNSRHGSARIILHQLEHFNHRGGQVDKQGPADDAVTNVEFHEIRNLKRAGRFSQFKP